MLHVRALRHCQSQCLHDVIAIITIILITVTHQVRTTTDRGHAVGTHAFISFHFIYLFIYYDKNVRRERERERETETERQRETETESVYFFLGEPIFKSSYYVILWRDGRGGGGGEARLNV